MRRFNKRQIFAVVSFCLTLLTVNFFYMQKVSILRNGASVFMPIYPLSSPQSGQRFLSVDYISPIPNTVILSEKGVIIITIDPMRVGQFKRIFQKGIPLSPDEHFLAYRIKRLEGLTSYNAVASVSFAEDEFFIPPGDTAEDYVNAVYAFLRIGKNGRAYLVGLADKDFRLLGQKPFDF